MECTCQKSKSPHDHKFNGQACRIGQPLLSSVKISLRLICGVDFELGVAAAGSSGSCCPYLPLSPISFAVECDIAIHCLPMNDRKILIRAGKLLCWRGRNPSLILRCHLWQPAIISRPRSHVQKPQRIQRNQFSQDLLSKAESDSL